MYISIPDNMVFEKRAVTVTQNGKEINEERDCLVYLNGEHPPIDLQSLVKEALRTNQGQKNEITLFDKKNNINFTAYLKRAPSTNQEFLYYTPNKNGKCPAEVEPKKVIGNTLVKHNPAKDTQYGQFWNQHAKLSHEKNQKVLTKREEQRNDRRHTGNSPKPT